MSQTNKNCIKNLKLDWESQKSNGFENDAI